MNLATIIAAIAGLDRDQLPALMLAIAARLSGDTPEPVEAVAAPAPDELLTVEQAAPAVGQVAKLALPQS